MDEGRESWGRPIPLRLPAPGRRGNINWGSLGAGRVSANGASSLPLGWASRVRGSRQSIAGGWLGWPELGRPTSL